MPRSGSSWGYRRALVSSGLVGSIALTCALSGTVPTASAAASPVPAGSTMADDGAFVASVALLDPRMVDVRISSPAVGATVPVRLLLPPGWSSTANRTWPVLYLLQGAHDDYTSWTRETGIEAFTADKDVIVAMPSAGPTGIPTRWLDGGADSPDYEAFDVTELWQLLRRDFRAGPVRALAGVSTGGYGAIALAAHHPGAFTAAASYSGILDTTSLGMPAIIDAIVAREDVQPAALWGDLSANAGLWAADNPYALASNLRWTSVFLSSGSGLPPGGQGGAPDNLLLGESLERALWAQAKSFAARLQVLGIPAQTDFYQGGVHDWPAWRGAFTASWPLLAAGLGLPS